MDAAPIYSHPITSIAEVGPILERYPDTSSSVRTTEQIHSLRYEDLESSLRIDQQFKTAFCGTLGFDVHEQVEASSHTYLQVVNSCLEECNLFSDLTITAIQCHQSAFKYFIEGDRSTAIELMRTTTGMAKALSNNFEAISRRIRAIREDTTAEIFVQIEQARIPLSIQQRVEERSGNTTSLSQDERTLRSRKIEALSGALCAFFSINGQILHLSSYFNGISRLCSRLSECDLADPDYLELLQSMDSPSNPGLDSFFAQAVTSIQKTMNPAPVPQEGPMRTGRALPLLQPEDRSFLQMVERSTTIGLEPEFRKNYLDWLTLAKAHNTTITLLPVIVLHFEQLHRDFARITTNPHEEVRTL